MADFRKNKKGKTYPLTPRRSKEPRYHNYPNDPSPSQNTLFEGAFAWYGCYAFPDHCLLIKVIGTVYKVYKQKPLNMQYEDIIENMMKRGIPKFASTITEDEIDTFSKEIIIYVNMSGLTYQISKNTHIDKNVVKDFMEGTISNLLKDKIENGTGFIVNKVIL